MIKYVLMLLFSFLVSTTRAQNNDFSHEVLLQAKKNPCSESFVEVSLCDVRIEVPLVVDRTLARRQMVADARSSCESLPITGKKEFMSREADGEGVVFLCTVNKDAFHDWWSKNKKDP